MSINDASSSSHVSSQDQVDVFDVTDSWDHLSGRHGAWDWHWELAVHQVVRACEPWHRDFGYRKAWMSANIGARALAAV